MQIEPTAENLEEMIAALDELVDSNVQVFGEFMGRRAVMSGWSSTPEGARALGALQTLWEMGEDEHLVYIGDRWEGRSLVEVVEWAVEQCQTCDPFDVGVGLSEFRKVAAVERIHYALVLDVWLEIEGNYFEFHDGTVLAKLGLHPDAALIEAIGKLDFTPVPIERHNLYLGFSSAEVCHFGDKPERHDSSDSARLRDVAMCINLSRPVDGVIVIAAISDFYTGNTPVTKRGFSWSIPHQRRPQMQNGIIEISLGLADAVYEQFLHCDEKLKDRIRIAARYLSHIGMASEPEDQLISLRVALEAFFLYPSPSSNDGIAETLGMRAAFLLGENDCQRKELKQLFKQVYNTLSRTAHSGRVHRSYRRDKVERVSELLQQSIRKLIENGEDFVWEDASAKPTLSKRLTHILTPRNWTCVNGRLF